MPPTGSRVSSSARGGCRRRSSRYRVMSRDPTAVGRPVKAVEPLGQPPGQVDPAGRDAQQDDRSVAVAFQDLMGDPVDGPGDVGPAEDLGEDLRGRGRPA